jgi:hypothetical protein
MKQTILLSLIIVVGSAWFTELKAQTLADLTTEYKTKRTAGLTGLNDAFKKQLEVVKKVQMEAGNLAGANATNAAIAGLTTAPGKLTAAPDASAAGLPPEAGRILADHSAKVCAGVIGLNKLYIPKYEALKVILLQSGDLDSANAAAAKVTQLNEEITTLTPLATAKEKPGGNAAPSDKPFTVEGYVDGNTELHITKDGFYWAVLGGQAKVGINGKNEEPCYVNGSRWKLKWRTQGDRGPDMCDVYPLPTPSLDLVAEVVSTTAGRYGKKTERAPISTSAKGDHFVILIPDPEGGSMWYKIRVKSSKAP